MFINQETKLKWNQEDLGQVPNTRLGISTSVQGPSPWPSGSHGQTATASEGGLWHYGRKKRVATRLGKTPRPGNRSQSGTVHQDFEMYMWLCMFLTFLEIYIFFQKLKKVLRDIIWHLPRPPPPPLHFNYVMSEGIKWSLRVLRHFALYLNDP